MGEPHGRPWTERQDDIVRTHWLQEGSAAIAWLLDRDPGEVHRRAKNLGVAMTGCHVPEYTERIKRRGI